MRSVARLGVDIGGRGLDFVQLGKAQSPPPRAVGVARCVCPTSVGVAGKSQADQAGPGSTAPRGVALILKRRIAAGNVAALQSRAPRLNRLNHSSRCRLKGTGGYCGERTETLPLAETVSHLANSRGHWPFSDVERNSDNVRDQVNGRASSGDWRQEATTSRRFFAVVWVVSVRERRRVGVW